MTMTGVGGLFFIGCPLAIFFAVAFIIIYSFYCKSFLRLPHIIKKILKRFTPFLGYANPPAAITRISFFGFIGATAYHSAPNRISLCSGHAVCPHSIIFFFKTAARFCHSRPKLIASGNCFIAALTNTLPHYSAIPLASFPYDGKPRIYMSSKI